MLTYSGIHIKCGARSLGLEFQVLISYEIQDKSLNSTGNENDHNTYAQDYHDSEWENAWHLARA